MINALDQVGSHTHTLTHSHTHTRTTHTLTHTRARTQDAALAELERDRHAEDVANIEEAERLAGTGIKYGQVFQLRHKGEAANPRARACVCVCCVVCVCSIQSADGDPTESGKFLGVTVKEVAKQEKVTRGSVWARGGVVVVGGVVGGWMDGRWW
jgi:hypothetical protein